LDLQLEKKTELKEMERTATLRYAPLLSLYAVFNLHLRAPKMPTSNLLIAPPLMPN